MMTESQHKFDAALERALTGALERRPRTKIPEDFAARVVALLPPSVAPRVHVRAGRAAGLGAGVVLAAVLLGLAPHASPSFSSVAFDMEMVVLAQLAAIACWLSVARNA